MKAFMELSTYVQIFSGAEDLMHSRSLPRPTVNDDTWEYHLQRSKDAAWNGGTVEQVTNALHFGWPEGLCRVQELSRELSKLVTPPVSYRRRQRWSDDGDEPSWEREQHGHDQIWRTSKRQSQRGPATVELLVPWGGPGGLSSDALMWNGVVLSVLADILENAGYRVGASLISATIWHHSTFQMVQQVIVKEPQQPLDLASIVPLVAHPGSRRIFGIAAKTLAPFNVTMGFGAVQELMNEQVKPVTVLQHPNAFKLRHSYSRSEAVSNITWLLQQIDPSLNPSAKEF